MNANAELLNFVYENSQMGVKSLRQILDMLDDDEFKKYLEKQLNGYEGFHEQAKEMLKKNGFDEKGLNAFEKVRTYLMINMQTLTDKSASHIAEMLIIGSSMGVIDAIKNVNKYKNSAEKDILELMDHLKRFEEKNVEKLKEYL